MRRVVRLWLRKQAAVDVVIGGLLFLTAGSARWLGGWLVVASSVASQAIQWLVIGRRRPDLLAERSGRGEGADRGDIPLAIAMAYGPFVGVLAAANERRLGRAPRVSPAVRIAAAGAVAASLGVSIAAMAANPFFAPVLRIQDDRGQTVASRGPYGIVRHPGYAGAILWDLAMPGFVGSRVAVPFGLASAALAVVRTRREDAYLSARLAGYAAYARRVRWRLVPHVW